MIIDYLASVGDFAFRHVVHGAAPDLVKLMDEEGIDRAVVSSLESILYRNVHKGNELMADRIDAYGDRLIGAAVINPSYPEAVEDAECCIKRFGMKAIRLYPNYHGYTLTDPRVGSVVSVAQEHSVPVSVAFRVEDERQRHWLIDPPAVSPEDVLSLVKAFPEVTFVMERASGGELSQLIAGGPDATNWFAETSGRFSSPGPIIKAIGPDRVLFGSDIPLQYARPSLLKLQSLELDETSTQKIMEENAANILKL
jgi:predicted TIM-barrel fold metal-dependent hydrolase